MTDWVTKQLAEYAVSTSYESYPSEAVEQSKLFVLDTIGCMIGGLQTTLGQSMLRAMTKNGGSGGSTVVGSASRTSIQDAALINGTTANALDFEETLAGLGHPSGTVIAAALAAGESRRISGKTLLDAILVGYDIGNRIGRAIQPTYERLKKVWFVGTWQTFGAAAAASKCLGLDLHQTLNAYGIAGATAPLPNTQKWGWELAERPIHWVKEPTGWPSWTGTMAALLAEQDFVGNRFILDGEKGFWAMAGSDQCDFAAMTRDLGRTYEVQRLSFKPYSCCRWQHAALDCVTEIMRKNSLRPDDIASVDIYSFDWVQDFEVYEPADMVDAEFSLPHAVTMILHGIQPGPGWFSHDALKNRKFIDYSRRVRVRFDSHYNDLYHFKGDIGARVEIVLGSGARLAAAAETPLGDPRKPLSRNFLEQKFLSLAVPAIGEAAATQVIDTVSALDDADSIDSFMGLLVPAG